MHFSGKVCFKTLKTKSPIDPEIFVEKHVLLHKPVVGKFEYLS